MQKSSLRTLKERYDLRHLERNNLYSQLLKRKRLEKKRTLEELAQGVCSPSYLSKIENAIVQVDTNYFQLLFEKLDIPFEDIERTRSVNLFQSLIRNYLINNKNEIEIIANQTINLKSFSETEIELVILFNNIIKGLYEEARILITKIEDIRNSLTNKELIFFVFSTTLYLYKTNQTERAYHQAQVLVEITYEDDLMKTAVYDLAADIFYKVGNYPSFNQYFDNLKHLNTTIISKRMVHHNLQKLVRKSVFNFEEAMVALESERQNIDPSDPEQLEDYYFYLGCAYYVGKKYEKVLELINVKPMSARLVTLIACALDRVNDLKLALDYLDNMKEFSFSKYEKLYANHFEYVRQKYEQYGYQRLMSILKGNLLASYKQNKDAFFYDIIINNYARLGFAMGRYKETLKTIIEHLE